MSQKKIKITLTKSTIGYRQRTKDTIKALGLRKLNSYVIKEKNSSINGMINAVNHLVKIEEIK